jgi:hypothetical protein
VFFAFGRTSTSGNNGSPGRASQIMFLSAGMIGLSQGQAVPLVGGARGGGWLTGSKRSCYQLVGAVNNLRPNETNRRPAAR